jgi:hypothetical protein
VVQLVCDPCALLLLGKQLGLLLEEQTRLRH